MLRISYLPDPRSFKVFAGLVLLYIGVRLFLDIIRKRKSEKPIYGPDRKFSVTPLVFGIRQIGYEFSGEIHHASTVGLFVLSFAVGIIGGTYGIGGGAIIAPFLVAIFGLPVYTIAGAALLATFLTSVAGVIFYTVIAPFYAHTGLAIAPDWMLGAMFGIGGALGMYVGARLQKYIPATVIKSTLVICIFLVAVRYIAVLFI